MENRLARVEDDGGSTIAEYYYDPFGRRLCKTVNSTVTWYLYSDEGLIGEYDSAGAEIKTYGYRPNSTWTTDPLFIKQGTEYYFYQNDHLGTPQKITNINGNVVWSAKYESFGEATIEVEAVVNNLRFPGQYYDSETELYYNSHRQYSPLLGRYLKRDPSHSIRSREESIPYLIPYLMRRCQELNGYTYVENNPIIMSDILGLSGHKAEQCEAELDECTKEALRNEALCVSVVGVGVGLCYAGCNLACLTLSGPAIPACLAACNTTCATFGEAGLVACSMILTAELAHCAYEYSICMCPH